MTFHISEALLIERAIVVSGTILLFGLVSIGGLLLLRRIMSADVRRRSAEPAIAQEYERQVADREREAIMTRIRLAIESDGVQPRTEELETTR